MSVKRQITSAALLAMFVSAALAPTALFADSRQSNKNTWRNLGTGAAVVAGYGLLHHDTTTTLLGAAGAAYSANRYEQDRHSQDQAKRARLAYLQRQRYHRLRYHRSTASYRTRSSRYSSGGRYYYTYHGHQYYETIASGMRHRLT